MHAPDDWKLTAHEQDIYQAGFVRGGEAALLDVGERLVSRWRSRASEWTTRAAEMTPDITMGHFQGSAAQAEYCADELAVATRFRERSCSTPAVVSHVSGRTDVDRLVDGLRERRESTQTEDGVSPISEGSASTIRVKGICIS